MSDAVDFGDLDQMEMKLDALRAQHRVLDERIQALEADGGHAFQVMGLKREKLRVKDQMVWIQARLTPDIIA